MNSFFSINTGNGGRVLPCEITVRASNDTYKLIEKTLMHLFEVEILQGSLTTTENETILTFNTENRDKVILLEQTIWKYFRDVSGLGETTNN